MQEGLKEAMTEDKKTNFKQKTVSGDEVKEPTTSRLDKIQEPLMAPNKDRFVLFPITQHKIWEFYKKAEASFWTAEEIDLQQDISDWEKLNDKEKHFIKHVLAFFAASDGIVLENLADD